MPSIVPCLWFDRHAEDAANFYVSVFPDSRIVEISRYGEGAPMPEGTVLTVQFVLDGVEFQALNGGPEFTFSEAISFSARAETQPEIDRLWVELCSGGGEPGQCGWLKDRYGVSWQVVPPILGQLLADPDWEKADRVMGAMLAMSKIEIPALQAAYDGR